MYERERRRMLAELLNMSSTTHNRNKTEKGVILEMCYFPHPWTVIAEIAQSAGWTVVTGEVAMIWQGIEVSNPSRSNIAAVTDFFLFFWGFFLLFSTNSNRNCGSNATSQTYRSRRYLRS